MGERNRYGRVIAARVPDNLARDVETLAALRGVSRSELLSALARKEIDMTIQDQMELAQKAVDALEAGDPDGAAKLLQKLSEGGAPAKPATKPAPELTIAEALSVLKKASAVLLSADLPEEIAKASPEAQQRFRALRASRKKASK